MQDACQMSNEEEYVVVECVAENTHRVLCIGGIIACYQHMNVLDVMRQGKESAFLATDTRL